MQIRDLIGCTYKPHGRDPAEGLDCYGAAIIALKILTGIDMPDAIHSETYRKDLIMRELEASIPHIKLDTPEPGAIVAIEVMGHSAHMGVCLGDGTFMHALETAGVVIEPLARYQHRIKGFYRVTTYSV